MNGKMMFLNQAKYAFNTWTNIMPEIDEEVIKLIRLMIKIGILGDIGSGKSYVAKEFWLSSI